MAARARRQPVGGLEPTPVSSKARLVSSRAYHRVEALEVGLERGQALLAQHRPRVVDRARPCRPKPLDDAGVRAPARSPVRRTRGFRLTTCVLRLGGLGVVRHPAPYALEVIVPIDHGAELSAATDALWQGRLAQRDVHVLGHTKKVIPYAHDHHHSTYNRNGMSC